jgi:hypothetical protein
MFHRLSLFNAASGINDQACYYASPLTYDGMSSTVVLGHLAAGSVIQGPDSVNCPLAPASSHATGATYYWDAASVGEHLEVSVCASAPVTLSWFSICEYGTLCDSCYWL